MEVALFPPHLWSMFATRSYITSKQAYDTNRQTNGTKYEQINDILARNPITKMKPTGFASVRMGQTTAATKQRQDFR